MNSEDLIHLPAHEVLKLLHEQVNIALDFYTSTPFVFEDRPSEDAIKNKALLAVGDFLIYPRFPKTDSCPDSRLLNWGEHLCKCQEK